LVTVSTGGSRFSDRLSNLLNFNRGRFGFLKNNKGRDWTDPWRMVRA
jgi:hypothetical protein